MNSPAPADSAAFRLKTARKALGKTQDEFGAPMGYAKAVVSNWEKGKTEITVSLAQSIQVNWGISWPWLVKGEGSPWVTKAAPAPEPREIEALTRPEIDETSIQAASEKVHEPAPHAPRHTLDRNLARDLLRGSGGGSEEDLYFFRCRDESMEPTILSQERVLINTALEGRGYPRNNGIYLVRQSPQDNDVRLRRIRLAKDDQLLLLLPDNRFYMPTVLELAGISLDQVVLGCVCWVGRSLLASNDIECVW